MITRRSFFRRAAAALAGLAIAPHLPTSIFTDPVAIGPVGEFETYIYWYAWVQVMNPRSCGVITNIGA